MNAQLQRHNQQSIPSDRNLAHPPGTPEQQSITSSKRGPNYTAQCSTKRFEQFHAPLYRDTFGPTAKTLTSPAKRKYQLGAEKYCNWKFFQLARLYLIWNQPVRKSVPFAWKRELLSSTILERRNLELKIWWTAGRKCMVSALARQGSYGSGPLRTRVLMRLPVSRKWQWDFLGKWKSQLGVRKFSISGLGKVSYDFTWGSAPGYASATLPEYSATLHQNRQRFLRSRVSTDRATNPKVIISLLRSIVLRLIYIYK